VVKLYQIKNKQLAVKPAIIKLNTLRRLAEDRKRPMVFPKVIHDRLVHGPTIKYKMIMEATEGQ
tara:strand:+ start:578 stop:769 length:192 start_codon:yes stop_codon:yes gene_type:complete